MANDAEPTFFDPQARREVYRRHLPHWRQSGSIYFVTFRLADSIPAARAAQLRREQLAWRQAHAELCTPELRQEYSRLFSARVEQWLDECQGSCLLTDPQCAQVVAETMESLNGQRYCLDLWVIMPNHVHVLVTPHQGFALKRILQTWKSFSAHAINRRLSRHGQLWQRESFDHIVRSPAHLEKFRRYICDNPAKAGRLAHLCRVRQS